MRGFLLMVSEFCREALYQPARCHRHCALCPGKWTVQQAAELSVPAPTIEAALDGRFLSGLKDQRVKAAKFFKTLGATEPTQQPVSCPAPGLHLPHFVQLVWKQSRPGL